MTTATQPTTNGLQRQSGVAVGRPEPRLGFPYQSNLAEMDRYLMNKGCIGPDLKALPGATAPRVAEFKEDGMYPVLDRIRRQHEREGLGSAVRHLFRERYGLEMHYGGNRSRKTARAR